MDKINKQNPLYIPGGKTFGYIFTFILLAAGIYWTAYLLNHGLSVADEPWQILNSMRPNEFPHAIFSHSIGHVWGSIFGFNIVSMRILATIFKILIYIVVIYPLYKETRNWCMALLTFSLMLLLTKSNYWNWGWVNHFFCALSLVVLLNWSNHQTYTKIAILGVLGAIFSLCRLPSIAVFAVDIMAILFVCKINRYSVKATLKYLGLFSLSFFCVIIVLLFIVSNGPLYYVDSLYVFKSDDHAIATLFYRYYTDIFYNILNPILGTLAIYFIYRTISSFKFKTALFRYLSWISYSLLVIYYLRTNIETSSFVDNFFKIFICFLALSYIDYVAFTDNRRSESQHSSDGNQGLKLIIAQTIIVAAYSFIPILGSDTGFRNNPIFILFPIIITLVIKVDRVRFVNFFYSLLYILVIFYFGIWWRSHSLTDDFGYLTSTEKPASPKVNIYTTPLRAEAINDIVSAADRYKGDNKSIMYLGFKHRFLFEFIDGVRQDNMMYDFLPGLHSPLYRNSTVDFLSKNHRDVLILPFIDGIDIDKEPTITEESLIDLGYKLKENHKYYRIYELD